MIGPVGRSGAVAESAAPTQPEIPPISPATSATRPARSVQNRAATAGMIKSANDENQADDLQSDHGHRHNEPHHRKVYPMRVNPGTCRVSLIERDKHHRTVQKRHKHQRHQSTDRDQDRVGIEHACGGPKKEAFQSRLPPGRHGLDDGQQNDPEPEEH